MKDLYATLLECPLFEGIDTADLESMLTIT